MQIRHDRKIHSAAMGFILLDQTRESKLRGSESLLKNLLQRAGKNNKGAAEDNQNPMLVFFSIQLIEPQFDVFHTIAR